jgi:LemA protein
MKAIVIDDERLARKELRSLLAKYDNVDVVDECANAVEGLKAAALDPSNGTTIQALAAAETALGGSLTKLMALVEAYPDLKANETMARLQEELSSTENKVAFSRQAFNDSVLMYNNATQNFPDNLVAKQFSFIAAEYLEIESETKRSVPEVSFEQRAGS